MDRKNKYSQYIGWGVTAFAVIAAGVRFYFGIDYMGKLIDALGKLLSILSPFIWGLVISFLLIPSMTLYERKLFKPLVLRINKTKPRLKTGTKLPRVLALILAEIVMLLQQLDHILFVHAVASSRRDRFLPYDTHAARKTHAVFHNFLTECAKRRRFANQAKRRMADKKTS